jgi:hypothetical protein
MVLGSRLRWRKRCYLSDGRASCGAIFPITPPSHVKRNTFAERFHFVVTFLGSSVTL